MIVLLNERIIMFSQEAQRAAKAAAKEAGGQGGKPAGAPGKKPDSAGKVFQYSHMYI